MIEPSVRLYAPVFRGVSNNYCNIVKLDVWRVVKRTPKGCWIAPAHECVYLQICGKTCAGACAYEDPHEHASDDERAGLAEQLRELVRVSRTELNGTAPKERWVAFTTHVFDDQEEAALYGLARRKLVHLSHTYARYRALQDEVARVCELAGVECNVAHIERRVNDRRERKHLRFFPESDY
jgi:hypothetical protein